MTWSCVLLSKGFTLVTFLLPKVEWQEAPLEQKSRLPTGLQFNKCHLSLTKPQTVLVRTLLVGSNRKPVEGLKHNGDLIIRYRNERNIAGSEEWTALILLLFFSNPIWGTICQKTQLQVIPKYMLLIQPYKGRISLKVPIQIHITWTLGQVRPDGHP